MICMSFNEPSAGNVVACKCQNEPLGLKASANNAEKAWRDASPCALL